MRDIKEFDMKKFEKDLRTKMPNIGASVIEINEKNKVAIVSNNLGYYGMVAMDNERVGKILIHPERKENQNKIYEKINIDNDGRVFISEEGYMKFCLYEDEQIEEVIPSEAGYVDIIKDEKGNLQCVKEDASIDLIKVSDENKDYVIVIESTDEEIKYGYKYVDDDNIISKGKKYVEMFSIGKDNKYKQFFSYDDEILDIKKTGNYFMCGKKHNVKKIYKDNQYRIKEVCEDNNIKDIESISDNLLLIKYRDKNTVTLIKNLQINKEFEFPNTKEVDCKIQNESISIISNNNGYIISESDGNMEIYNEKGNMIETEHKILQMFSEVNLIVTRDEEYKNGLIHSSGKILMQPEYEKIIIIKQRSKSDSCVFRSGLENMMVETSIIKERDNQVNITTFELYDSMNKIVSNISNDLKNREENECIMNIVNSEDDSSMYRAITELMFELKDKNEIDKAFEGINYEAKSINISQDKDEIDKEL